jgi:hyperosmotically inducible periplasmic protein
MKDAKLFRATVATAMILALPVYAHATDSATSNASTVVSSKAANRALAKKVHHALARTNGLEPGRIYVKAVNGDVTLTGSVESSDQINLATKAAQGVAGVNSVNNKMTVRPRN